MKSDFADPNMIELKKCPFCAGHASVMQNHLNYWLVVCDQCYVRTDAMRIKEKAIELWNQRKLKEK